jgi:hypothetical protein
MNKLVLLIPSNSNTVIIEQMATCLRETLIDARTGSRTITTIKGLGGVLNRYNQMYTGTQILSGE